MIKTDKVKLHMHAKSDEVCMAYVALAQEHFGMSGGIAVGRLSRRYGIVGGEQVNSHNVINVG